MGNLWLAAGTRSGHAFGDHAARGDARFLYPRQKAKPEGRTGGYARAAAKDLDEMIASWGASEDELMEQYKGIRQAAREKKRNAK